MLVFPLTGGTESKKGTLQIKIKQDVIICQSFSFFDTCFALKIV